MLDLDLRASQSLEPPPERHLQSDWLHWMFRQLPHMMGMSSTKPTPMIEKHRPVTQVGLHHPIPKTNPSKSPSQGLDLGECVLHERLDNRRNLRHAVLEERGTIHSASTISWMNPREQTIKDAIWKASIQTNSKEIDPRLDNS